MIGQSMKPCAFWIVICSSEFRCPPGDEQSRKTLYNSRHHAAGSSSSFRVSLSFGLDPQGDATARILRPSVGQVLPGQGGKL